MSKLIATIGSDIDLVIDDGDHNAKSQLRAFQLLMPLLKKDCIYVIEDIMNPFALRDRLLSDGYNSYAMRFSDKPELVTDTLLIARKR